MDEQIPILDLGPELEEVGRDLEAAFRRVVASRHFINGPEVEAFEREVAAHLGVKHAVGVNSGTDALVLALRALDVGPGDEVITSPFTFFASAESISAVGATPVFVDIEPATFCVRVDHVAEAMTPRTKALMPVHLFGQAADMEPILALAQKAHVAVVEDVAQAFGGKYQGRLLGTLGSVGAYSFFPSKNLGCLGDGGLLATNDDAIADRARMLAAHGSRRKYFNEAIGYNSRLDALQAALLRAKLPHVDAWNALRRKAAERYGEMLRGLDGIALPVVRPGAEHVYHQYTVRVGGDRRDELRTKLAAVGIGTMIYYPKSLHQLPVYSARGASFPASESASQEVLSLPIWPNITPATQQRVADAIRTIIEKG